MSEPTAYTRRAETAPAYWSFNILWLMLATHQDTGGRHSLIEELVPHGMAAPAHQHDNAEEGFYVLDGRVTFFVRGERHELVAGDYLAIPHATPHRFQVESPDARLLNSYAPAGFEQTIIALAEPATALTLPPSGLPAVDLAASATRIAAIVEQYPAAATTNFF